MNDNIVFIAFQSVFLSFWQRFAANLIYLSQR
jgi:hypothetical protein